MEHDLQSPIIHTHDLRPTKVNNKLENSWNSQIIPPHNPLYPFLTTKNNSFYFIRLDHFLPLGTTPSIYSWSTNKIRKQLQRTKNWSTKVYTYRRQMSAQPHLSNKMSTPSFLQIFSPKITLSQDDTIRLILWPSSHLMHCLDGITDSQRRNKSIKTQVFPSITSYDTHHKLNFTRVDVVEELPYIL